MASSETQICNLALAHLGEAPIQSLEEDNVASRACALHYNLTRDELLRSHRWNFAVKRAALSQLEEDPAFGYAAQFQLPADCLRVIEFNDTAIGDVISEQFSIEGRALLTDSESVNILYIRKVADVALFDALFVKALALRLAIELSETIRGTTGKTAELTAAYERAVAPLARRVDANESGRRKGLIALNSPFVRWRGEGGGLPLTSASSSSGGANLGLYALKAPLAGGYRIANGIFELWNVTQNKYQPVALSGEAGAETFTVLEDQA